MADPALLAAAAAVTQAVVMSTATGGTARARANFSASTAARESSAKVETAAAPRTWLGLFAPTLVLLALMWLFEIVDQVFLSGDLDALGIRPREVGGLFGILTWPLLHGGWEHLFSNTTAILVLGPLATWSRPRDFVLVIVSSWMIAGAAVWAMAGGGSTHIGASGLAFGLLGYLMLRGIFERQVWSVVVSAVLLFMYGSVLFGMVPIVAGAGISWQGHLFGFLCGVAVASIYRNRTPSGPKSLTELRASK